MGLAGPDRTRSQPSGVATDARLQLLRQGEIVLDIQAPKDDASDSWAKAAAALTAASLPVSAPVRRAGTQGIIEGFFNQLFSRLDPYSRYVPPVEASEDRARRAGRAGLGLTLGEKQRGPENRGRIGRAGHADRGGFGRTRQPGRHRRDKAERYPHRGRRSADAGPGPGHRSQRCWPVPRAPLSPCPGVDATDAPERRNWSGSWCRRRPFSHERSDDVLVLRVSSFSNSTASHMALSVQDALSEPHPVGGIVLDLRDNRGGLLRQAVTAADTFLPAGLVATTVGRDADSKNVWRSSEGELAENVPVDRPGRWPHRQRSGNSRRRPRRSGTRRRGRQ